MSDQIEKPELSGSPDNQQMGGGFEGASKINRELALWDTCLRSADSEILFEKDTLDSRSLDLQRNDGYIHGAIQGHKDSIVGGFYRVNCNPNYQYLGLDEAWAEEFQQKVESDFCMVAESTDNWLDASRKLSFSDMIRLAVGMGMMAGENLATAEWLRGSGRPFNTAIQMIDPVRLDNPVGSMPQDGWRKGVKINQFGEPIRYAIRKAFKNDLLEINGASDFRIIPARKPWGRKLVLHQYEPYRVGQNRGVSDLVSILKQSKMVGKYQDIVLQNAVLNATYAATIESDLPPTEAFESIGGGQMTTWAENYLNAISEYTGAGERIKVDGVKIPHLYPGTKLNLKNAGNPGGVGERFEESLLRHLAAGLGMSYEEFSHDFTKTNYSSARAAMLETWKRQQGRKKIIADSFATDIFRLWFEEQLNKGEFNDVLPRNAPDFYAKLNKDAYMKCSWIGAPRGQIDELKETNAAIARIDAGLSTYEKECARFGWDYREIFDQRMREQRKLDELNINPNSEKVNEDAGRTDQTDDDEESRS